MWKGKWHKTAKKSVNLAKFCSLCLKFSGCKLQHGSDIDTLDLHQKLTGVEATDFLVEAQREATRLDMGPTYQQLKDLWMSLEKVPLHV